MRTCCNCKLDKPQTDFHKGKTRCKPCTAIYDRDKARTPEGLVRRVYNNQRMTTRKMGRALPAYTYEQLCLWLDAQPEFHILYHAWVAGGYAKDDSPSVDRKDNTIGYTLNNIQVVSWRQNLLNQKKQNLSGEYLHTGSKAINQLSLDGAFIAKFESIGIALRHIKGDRKGTSNVAAVADGKWQSAYGYKWEWA